MQFDDKKPIQGWKAAGIMLGVAAFLLLATWVMTTSDRNPGLAANTESGQTVGLAPQRPPAAAKN